MAALSSEAVIDVIEEEHFDGPGDDEAAEAARKELARAASSPAPFPAVAKAGAAGDDGRVRARSGKKRTKFVQAGGSDLEGGKKRPHPPPPTEAPQVTSPWWSRATWHFATGLIYLAWRSPPLMEEDVWPLPREETAEELADKFLAEWAMEQERVKTLPPPKPQKDQTGPLPNHPPPSLLKALFRAFGRPLYTAAMLRYICEAGSLATPILLGRLVTYLAQCSFAYKLGQPDLCPAPWIGYMLAFGIFCISLIVSWCFGKHFQLSAEVGFRVRTALSVAVYRKSLRLSSAARLRWSGGAVVNLLSTDCARIDRTLKEIHTIHAAPIVIIVGFALMINTIGVSALASLAVIFVSIPLSGVIMSQAAKIRKRTNAITDERVKLTQEVISGIRVVKYLGWESAMTDRILKLRTAELKGIRAVLWTWVIVGVLSMAIPILSAFAMFLTYSSISTTPLTSAVVLQCISLVEVIRWPLLLLPLALQWATDSTVSLGRLQRMLSAEELEEKTSEQQEIADMADEKAPAVEIRNARFAWEEVAPEEDDPAKAAEKADAEKAAKKLKREEEKAKRKVKEMEEEEAKQRDGSNWVWRTKTKRGQKQAEPAAVELAAKAAVEAVDAPTDEPKPAESDGTFNLDIDRLEIKRNAFVCVVGAVGSGKSSLISALIKDMKLVGPADSSAAYSVALRGRVAYCPQLAWIQNASIKDNITFGRPLDQARFDDVIRVCAMEKDLDMLPDGPETMVGEKGLTLSGGQKQRTSLARAVYADADVYLLDDPLSAVDAHVSNHIVQQTLLGALANKTRVLTTHQLHVLPHCDYVVVMRQGAIVEQGTFKGLLAQEDGYLAALVRDYGAGLAEEEEETALEVSAGDQPLADDNNTQRRASQTVIDQRRASQARIKIGRGPSTTSIPAGAKPDLGATVTPDKKQPRELMSQEERTEGAVALSVYADYIRFGGGVLKFAGPVALMLILMQSAKILTDWWVSSAWAANRFPLALSGYQGIYAALAIIQLVFVALGGIILAAGATKAAANIHSQALSNVLRAPVNTFFDVTPVGRIMNRLSKDTDIVDSWIPDITNW